MREYKFRAWDEELQKMYAPDELEQSDIQSDIHRTIYSYLSFGILCIYDFRSDPPAELQPLPFTGWYDKRQREIFEDDLLRMDQDVVRVQWNGEAASFVLSAAGGTFMIGGDYLADSAEIIGNIYETAHAWRQGGQETFREESGEKDV